VAFIPGTYSGSRFSAIKDLRGRRDYSNPPRRPSFDQLKNAFSRGLDNKGAARPSSYRTIPVRKRTLVPGCCAGPLLCVPRREQKVVAECRKKGVTEKLKALVFIDS
jgi:hypothetical protein